MTPDIIERMRVVMRILLGGDERHERFQVVVAGDPHAIDKMLEDARAVLAEAEKLEPAVLCTWHVDGEPKYNYWRIRILDQPKEPT
jgi:hypothetical protein